MRPHHTAASLLQKYNPRTLGDVRGQPAVIDQLESFASDPYSTAFVFHGASGVGKTCTAKALAHDLGCVDDFDMGGISEIPSGKQDGKAVDDLLRSLRLRPFYGSGWKVAVVNEADFMTPQAEGIWLDGLEHLPDKSVIVFTTNRIRSLAQRLVGRCEICDFDGSSPDFLDAMQDFVRYIWKQETGKALRHVPADLGRFELESDEFSIRLALQQIAPYIRTGDAPPAQFKVPFVRDSQAQIEARLSAIAHKAVETRRQNLARKAAS